MMTRHAFGTMARTVAQSPIILCSAVASLADAVTTPPAPAEADMRGKTVVVTGANTGVGFHTATRLAKMGATVILACRDQAKADAAKVAIEAKANAKGRVEVVICDLCDLASVRRCAAALAPRRVDVLVLNAGINSNTPHATHRDLPPCCLVFAVNFVAQWLLYDLLAPFLHDEARVVCLSSVMHHFADPATFFDNDPDRSVVSAADYSESKLAMNLLARDISRKKTRGALGVAVNPGAVDSEIWRHVWPALKPGLKVVASLFFLSPDQGSATSVYAAAMPLDLDGQGQPPYLAPYAEPSTSFPAASSLEFIGPFSGAKPAFCRLPRDDARVGAALLEKCRALCGDFAKPLDV